MPLRITDFKINIFMFCKFCKAHNYNSDYMLFEFIKHKNKLYLEN